MALQPAQDPERNPVLYFPCVNRTIVEQLERQLRRCADGGADGVEPVQPDAPARDALDADMQQALTPRDLQAGLMLIAQAGVAMDDLRRMPSVSSTLLDVYEVVSALQRRVVSQEREIDQILDELHDARAEIEISHRRVEAAEIRLRNFMSLLKKIISPYGRRMVFGADLPAERRDGSTATGGVES